MAEDKVKISVIIVNWNVCDLLQACLSSLFQQTMIPDDQYEVVVVDNASNDGSVVMVKKNSLGCGSLKARRTSGLPEPITLPSPSLEEIYLLLLNPDTVVLDDVVGSILAYAESHSDVAVAGCRLLNTDLSLQRWTGGAFPTLWNVAAHYLWLDRFIPAKWRRAKPAILTGTVSPTWKWTGCQEHVCLSGVTV